MGIFDVTHCVWVRDASKFGDGIPRQALGFPGLTDLSGDTRGRIVSTGAFGRREFFLHLVADFIVPRALFGCRWPYKALGLLLSHAMILCFAGLTPRASVTGLGPRMRWRGRSY